MIIHTLPQTHWINGKHPAAVPPGMEHAILLLDGERVFVDTLASMLTKSAYPPKVEPNLPTDTPAVIRATDEDMATAAQYEQNIRELLEWPGNSAREEGP